MTLCLFVCFALLLLLLSEVSGLFVLFYMAFLHCDAVVALFHMQQFLRRSDEHPKEH